MQESLTLFTVCSVLSRLGLARFRVLGDRYLEPLWLPARYCGHVGEAPTVIKVGVKFWTKGTRRSCWVTPHRAEPHCVTISKQVLVQCQATTGQVDFVQFHSWLILFATSLVNGLPPFTFLNKKLTNKWPLVYQIQIQNTDGFRQIKIAQRVWCMCVQSVGITGYTPPSV